MPAARYTKMKAITTIARILQIVNDTNYTVTPNGSYSPAPTVTQGPSLSSTTFTSYTPTQTFNMSAYYSATVSPMQSQSLSSSPSVTRSVTQSVTPSVMPIVTATPTPKITYQVAQSSSPFYALTPEQWAYILVPCICFAVITCWCNVKLWSRVEDLDHELKQYQSQRIQNNPAYHSSVRNVIPFLKFSDRYIIFLCNSVQIISFLN